MRNPQRKSGKGPPPLKNILNNKTEASGEAPSSLQGFTRVPITDVCPRLGVGDEGTLPACPGTPGHSVRATDPWFEGLSTLEMPQTEGA